MVRIGKHEHGIQRAALESARSTCCRGQRGCVLVDSMHQILSTGRNGVPRGAIHCIDKPCAGAGAASGTELSKCKATHAEANALLQCQDVDSIYIAYCTTEPCIDCTKLLLNTSVKQVIFRDQYPHGKQSKALWEECGRDVCNWIHLKLEEKEEKQTQPSLEITHR